MRFIFFIGLFNCYYACATGDLLRMCISEICSNEVEKENLISSVLSVSKIDENSEGHKYFLKYKNQINQIQIMCSQFAG